MQHFYEKMSDEDKNDFPLNMNADETDEQLIKATNGIRKYYLKETDDDLAVARRRLKIFRFIRYVYLVMFYGSLMYWLLSYLTARSEFDFTAAAETI